LRRSRCPGHDCATTPWPCARRGQSLCEHMHWPTSSCELFLNPEASPHRVGLPRACVRLCSLRCRQPCHQLQLHVLSPSAPLAAARRSIVVAPSRAPAAARCVVAHRSTSHRSFDLRGKLGMQSQDRFGSGSLSRGNEWEMRIRSGAVK
jgi:hypothetical protein